MSLLLIYPITPGKKRKFRFMGFHPRTEKANLFCGTHANEALCPELFTIIISWQSKVGLVWCCSFFFSYLLICANAIFYNPFCSLISPHPQAQWWSLNKTLGVLTIRLVNDIASYLGKPTLQVLHNFGQRARFEVTTAFVRPVLLVINLSVDAA